LISKDLTDLLTFTDFVLNLTKNKILQKKLNPLLIYSLNQLVCAAKVCGNKLGLLSSELNDPVFFAKKQIA
jgi:hypothetical protein